MVARLLLGVGGKGKCEVSGLIIDCCVVEACQLSLQLQLQLGFSCCYFLQSSVFSIIIFFSSFFIIKSVWCYINIIKTIIIVGFKESIAAIFILTRCQYSET